MKFVGDFHIHSKYSRAVSPLMDLENLDNWAKIKGIKVLGTGDFTHPKWFESIKEKMSPAEQGLFKLKKGHASQRGRDGATRFLLTSEISCIYKKNDKVRKIHIIVFGAGCKRTGKNCFGCRSKLPGRAGSRMDAMVFCFWIEIRIQFFGGML